MKKNINQYILLIPLLLALFWKPLFAFITPGILIFFIPYFQKKDTLSRIAYTITLSMSFWIIIFWFLRYIPLKLSVIFYVTIIITTILLIYFNFKNKSNDEIKTNWKFILISGILLLSLIIRLSIMHSIIVGPGADMCMHTYVTDLIISNNSVPRNYNPILEINEFDSFSTGFHTLSALISLSSHIPAYRSTILMTCITFFFITLALFVFLKIFVTEEAAIITALIISFISSTPQTFSFAGTIPTILSIGFVIMFLDSIVDISKKNIIFSGIILGAAFLTHAMIFMISAYVIGISMLGDLIITKANKKRIINYLLVLIVFFIVVSPYLISFDYKMNNDENITWFKPWIQESDHSWKGDLSNSILTIPKYILQFSILGSKSSLIPIAFLTLIAGSILAYKYNFNFFVKHILFMITTGLLILNSKYWILPFSFSIYPERSAAMAIIPISFFISHLFDHNKLKAITDKLKIPIKKNTIQKIIMLFLIILTIAIIPIHQKLFIKPSIELSSVTQEDMNAFNWISKNINETSIIENNYGDGGIWIPAIIRRQVDNTHVNFIYLNKITHSKPPEYVYIGKKCVYENKCQLKPEHFVDQEKYQLIYLKNDVYIFKINKKNRN